MSSLPLNCTKNVLVRHYNCCTKPSYHSNHTPCPEYYACPPKCPSNCHSNCPTSSSYSTNCCSSNTNCCSSNTNDCHTTNNCSSNNDCGSSHFNSFHNLISGVGYQNVINSLNCTSTLNLSQSPYYYDSSDPCAPIIEMMLKSKKCHDPCKPVSCCSSCKPEPVTCSCSSCEPKPKSCCSSCDDHHNESKYSCGSSNVKITKIYNTPNGKYDIYDSNCQSKQSNCQTKQSNCHSTKYTCNNKCKSSSKNYLVIE